MSVPQLHTCTFTIFIFVCEAEKASGPNQIINIISCRRTLKDSLLMTFSLLLIDYDQIESLLSTIFTSTTN